MVFRLFYQKYSLIATFIIYNYWKHISKNILFKNNFSNWLKMTTPIGYMCKYSNILSFITLIKIYIIIKYILYNFYL